MESFDYGWEWLSYFAREAEACRNVSKVHHEQRKTGIPKMASTIWSVDPIADEKLSVKGTSRSSNCFASRYIHGQRPHTFSTHDTSKALEKLQMSVSTLALHTTEKYRKASMKGMRDEE